jgi:succinoglycan biosynthesis transport protein ExoP
MGHDRLTIHDVAHLFRQRRAFIGWTLGGFLLAAALYCVLAQRRYDAVGVVQVDKENARAIAGLKDVVGGESDAAVSDSLDFNTTMQTQADVLKSDTLALQVIKELKLESTAEFFPPEQARSDYIPTSIFPWGDRLEPLRQPIDEAPNRRAVALRKFANRLKVQPKAGTRLIEIRYSDRDPKRAAEVVNRLIAALTSFSFRSRTEATGQIAQWLSGQLGSLKSGAEKLEAHAVELRRQTGTYGGDDARNLTVARLEALNTTYLAAQSDRMLKEAIYRAAESGNPELISGLAGNGVGNGLGSTTDAFATLTALRKKQMEVRARLAEEEVRYGPAYPRLAEEHAQLESIERDIAREAERIRARAGSDFEVARRTEDAAARAYEAQRSAADRLGDKRVELAITEQEAQGSRDLYGKMFASLTQAGMLSGLQASNITVVSQALEPAPDAPRHPNKPLVLAAAMLCGLIFGTVGAGIREATDPTIRSVETLEAALGQATAGVLPNFRNRQGFGLPARGEARWSNLVRWGLLPGTEPAFAPALVDPESAFSEALRSLRTSLLLDHSGKPPQTMIVTSSLSAEGKSAVSLNLAITLAQLGAKTLLVDGDLRRSTIARLLALSCEAGLSEALGMRTMPNEVRPFGGLPLLTVVTAGQAPPLPAELLGSERLHELFQEWRRRFDFVIVDSPPLLPLADALLLAQEADACLLVVRHGATSRQAAEKSFRSLRQHLPAAVKLYAVLNAVARNSADYYDYYGYKAPYGRQKASGGIFRA